MAVDRAALLAQLNAGQAVMLPDGTVIKRAADLPTQDELDASAGAPASILVTGFPENEEIVALPSGKSTTAWRVSDWISNKWGKSLILLVEVSEINGTGTLNHVVLEAKVGEDFIEFLPFLNIDLQDAGAKAILVATPSAPPASSGEYTQWVQGVMPRTYRIRGIASGVDNAGNDITYSVTVVHLL